MSHANVLVVVEQAEIDRLGLELAIGWQLEPFEESAECFADGSRWDWYQIGGRFSGKFYGSDVVRMADLDLGRLVQYKRQSLIDNYVEAMRRSDKTHMEFLTGVKPEESLQEYLDRRIGESKFPASYAFLRDRHWHESERMGWFGTSTATECERKAELQGNSDVEVMVQRCLHKDEKTGARIVCWNEPFEIWQQEFYRRFIEPLPKEATLVSVDYHV